MNPLLSAALGAILRWLLAMAAGVFVQYGIWSSSDATTYVSAATLALLALGLSLWNKYRGRIKLLTALTMPPGVTEQEVKDYIAAGGAVPAAMTKSTDIPTPVVP